VTRIGEGGLGCELLLMSERGKARWTKVWGGARWESASAYDVVTDWRRVATHISHPFRRRKGWCECPTCTHVFGTNSCVAVCDSAMITCCCCWLYWIKKRAHKVLSQQPTLAERSFQPLAPSLPLHMLRKVIRKIIHQLLKRTVLTVLRGCAIGFRWFCCW